MVDRTNFSNEIVTTNRLILRESRKFTSGTEKVADTFNNFFVNAGKTLKTDKSKNS